MSRRDSTREIQCRFNACPEISSPISSTPRQAPSSSRCIRPLGASTMDAPDLQHIPVNLPLGSQLPPGFDPNDSQPFQTFASAIGDMDHGLSTSNTYVRPSRPGDQPNNLIPQQTGVVPPPRPQQVPASGPFESRNSNNNNGRFAVPPPRPDQDLTAANSQVNQSQPGQRSLAESSRNFNARTSELELVSSLDQSLQQPGNQLQKDGNFFSTAEATADKQEGYFSGMKLIPNPPDLQAWRERLFNVDEVITLTEEQYGCPGPASGGRMEFY